MSRETPVCACPEHVRQPRELRQACWAREHPTEARALASGAEGAESPARPPEGIEPVDEFYERVMRWAGARPSGHAAETAGLLAAARHRTGPAPIDHHLIDHPDLAQSDEEIVREATARAHQTLRAFAEHSSTLATYHKRLRSKIDVAERGAEYARRELLRQSVRAAILRTALHAHESTLRGDDQSPSSTNRDDQS